MEGGLTSPYADRPARSFWKTGVAEAEGPVLRDLYVPKYALDQTMPIATAGSCFAQHIGRAMRARGFNVLDGELGPEAFDDATAQRFGYRTYSARYANIYTVRQLLQLMREAFDGFVPPEQVWEKDGRFYDAMRPSVEPFGLSSAEMVLKHREHHLAAVRTVFTQAKVLIFTMGLTEAWVDAETGCAYPTAPGTIAGSFDPARYAFVNYDYPQVRADLVELRRLLKRVNTYLKIILTVSPVPLTATAGDEHVLAATTYSKSVLRAVAGSVAGKFDNVDYFPSYEIITGPQARGKFFAANLRSIEPIGVATAMATFFAEDAVTLSSATTSEKNRLLREQRLARRSAREARAARGAARGADADGGNRQAIDDDVVCEDALLEAFSR